jgi:hypothetical protein
MGSELAIAKPATLVAKAKKALELIKALVVDDDESMAVADKMLAQIATQKKAVHARQLEEKRPHLDAEREIGEKYKPALTLYKKCEEALRDKIREPLRLQREAQARALAKVEAKGGVVGKETLAVAHGRTQIEKPQGIVETSELMWEVEDIKKVPRKYLCLSDEAVQLALSVGTLDIPGLRIWREWDIRRKGVVQK